MILSLSLSSIIVQCILWFNITICYGEGVDLSEFFRRAGEDKLTKIQEEQHPKLHELLRKESKTTESSPSDSSLSSSSSIVEKTLSKSKYEPNSANKEKIPTRVHMNSNEMSQVYNTPNASKDVEINWSNVVMYILTFDSRQPSNLLRAQFETWVPLIKDSGLDIVIVTDDDDTRTYQEIVPQAMDVKPMIHVYKSPAPKEGAMARSKVVDAMAYIQDRFGDNENKQFFIKLDTDTLVLPHNLIRLLRRIHQRTNFFPVDFGNVNCFTKDDSVCYTQGGLYGMNKIGFEATYHYIHKRFIEMTAVKIDSHNSDANLMEHEDFFTSYAFRQATGFPALNVYEISENVLDEYQVSIHPAKPVTRMTKYYNTFFDERGNARTSINN